MRVGNPVREGVEAFVLSDFLLGLTVISGGVMAGMMALQYIFL
jgi:hypothetical protein